MLRYWGKSRETNELDITDKKVKWEEKNILRLHLWRA